MSLSSDQLTHLLDLSRVLAITLDLESLLPRAARITCQVLGCERASVYFLDESTHELWTQVAIGTDPIRLDYRTGLAGHVFQTGESVWTPDAYADPRFNRAVDEQTGFRTRDLLTVPILDLDRCPVGVLQAINHRDGFSRTHLDLCQLLADQIGVVVQRHRLHEQVIESVRIRHEMELAAQVQTELLPREVPAITTLDVAGWSVPASVTGGDCYDLWQLNDGRLAMLLADAAGHGMAAAMVVAQVRSLIRVLTTDTLSPADVLNKVNARLSEDLSPNRFVTAVLVYLSSTGEVEMASAGHGPILVSSSGDSVFEQWNASGLPLVVDPESTVQNYPIFHLQPGGQIVLVSDGIFEAPSRSGEQLGTQRLETILGSQTNRPADQQIAHLRQIVRTWSDRTTPKDDQTIIIARRTR
ncbi:MAG: hypothetical protein KatS3mg104_2342 [Phycisphaerae bacterium]|nr:MAG: hypothetical protein KatS3mg104_2342 [Phycisphaerae bacterium]